MNELNITEKSRVRIYWDDLPENYSVEGKNRIVAHFAKEYDIPKTKIKVVFRASKNDSDGDLINIEEATIDNIMDKTYQRGLFKEWLEKSNKEVDFERILSLDDKVNSSLSEDYLEKKYRSWKINKLYIDNFLCFGDGNKADFNKLKGLNVVSSDPRNQGGKSSFIVDTIKFLLFGKTSKTDKNEEIFNSYTDKDELNVKGEMSIDGSNYIIERKLKRKLSKSGGYNVTSSLNYYEVLPDGEESKLEGEHSIETTKHIVETIGSEKDFETVIIATGRNLEDLIDSKPTERGKLLTRFIGLEVIEQKESIARTMYNQFQKTMKGNIYNTIDLNDEIVANELEIKTNDGILIKCEENDKVIKKDILNLEEMQRTLLGSKKQIDVNINKLDPIKLKEELTEIETKGKQLREDEKVLNAEIKELGSPTFDEERHIDAMREKNQKEVSIATTKDKIKTKEEHVEQLKTGSICPTCKRPLEDVDHSSEIKKFSDEIISLNEELVKYGEEKDALLKELKVLETNRRLVNTKDQLELKLGKLKVDIGILGNNYKETKANLKGYESNIDSIEFNKNIDSEVALIIAKLGVENNKLQQNISLIEKTKTSTEQLTIKNNENRGLIKSIEKEKEIEKIFKIYIEMVGKKGISKMVLKSVLPIINAELHNLLDGVCDFDIELTINSKNEVEFILIKDDVIKSLKSGSGFEKTSAALALRCVLGRISTLPKPNFIAFDEVLGKVSDTNLDNIKLLFDRIKDLYELVFLITHNNIVNDWADNIVTITKNENISTININ